MPPVISDEESEQTPIDLDDEIEEELDSDIEMDDEEDEDEDLDEELEAIVGPKDDDEVPSISDDEDNYQLEDPDELEDMDDDLELKDEDDEVAKPPPTKAYSQQPPPRRKPTVSYYEQDPDEDDEEEDEVSTPTSMPVKRSQRIQDLDPDLILTDEETEYNPDNHTSRERHRKMGEDQFIELGANGKKPLAKTETEEQAAVRKAENARRRLDYKNKQLEEEKRDTLNKLLKRRAVKVRDNSDADSKDESKVSFKPRRPMMKHPGFLKYVNNTTDLNGNSTLSYNV